MEASCSLREVTLKNHAEAASSVVGCGPPRSAPSHRHARQIGAEGIVGGAEASISAYLPAVILEPGGTEFWALAWFLVNPLELLDDEEARAKDLTTIVLQAEPLVDSGPLARRRAAQRLGRVSMSSGSSVGAACSNRPDRIRHLSATAPTAERNPG